MDLFGFGVFYKFISFAYVLLGRLPVLRDHVGVTRVRVRVKMKKSPSEPATDCCNRY